MLSFYKDIPDWRYHVAQIELNRVDGNEDDFVKKENDIYVLQLVDYIRQKQLFPPEFLKTEFPVHSFLYDIYMSKGANCIRHALEACIIAGAHTPFIQKNVSKLLNKSLVQLYKKLYFDIDEHKDSPFWMESKVFTPNEKHQGEELVSACVWKIVAYTGGVSRLLKDCLRGQAYTAEDMEEVRRLAVSEHTRNTRNNLLSGKAKNAPIEIAAASYDRAIADITKVVESRNDSSSQNINLNIQETNNILTSRLRLISSGDEQTAVEFFEDVERYTEEDIKKNGRKT